MARAAPDANGWLVRSIALGSVAILVGVVGWTLITVLTNSNNNANRLTSIETRLERMEQDIQRIADGR